jgi:hypothetical protein
MAMTKLLDVFRAEDVRRFVAIAPPYRSERDASIFALYSPTPEAALFFPRKYTVYGIAHAADPWIEFP